MENEKDLITVFVTKFALTRGVFGKEVRISRSAPDMAVTLDRWAMYLHKGEWFLTEEEAKADAENRRKKKIVSLKKQIEKLEKLKF